MDIINNNNGSTPLDIFEGQCILTLLSNKYNKTPTKKMINKC